MDTLNPTTTLPNIPLAQANAGPMFWAQRTRRMHLASIALAGAIVLLCPALAASAAETWRCTAIEECKSVSTDCKPSELAFGFSIDGTPQSLRMSLPGPGPLMMPLVGASADDRVFEAEKNYYNHTITLKNNGMLVGAMSQTSSEETVIYATISASCRQDPA
jgi:hypothetical protein